MSKTPAQRAAKHGGTPISTPPQTAAGGWAKALRDKGVERKQAQLRGEPTGGNAGLILVAAGAASVFLFWYLHLLTLNQMTQISGGLAMPDSLFGGFSTGYVDSLRHAMNSDAKGQLQFVHKTAGLLFPVVLAVTAGLAAGLNLRTRWRRWGVIALAIAFVLVSLGANVAVDTILGNSTLDGGLVALASVLVVASWVLLALTVLSSVVAIIWGRKQGQRQSRSQQQGRAQGQTQG
ncbi:MAG: hypothetical protein HIU81_06945 [Acidobacteria bacterium]|nr:hypothetical protein [Acidobacteriota bacterium]